MQRKILISFDVEEFDIPLEYNQPITKEEQLAIGHKGLQAVLPIVEAHKVPCTMFTTACYAQHFPDDVKRMTALHEIASHTFDHSYFENEHLLSSKQVLESISGQPVHGLRMPRMRPVAMQAVKNAGYLYDSSINPTWLPGRYNNFHLPRTSYMQDGMLRIPASVSPVLRIPLFWLGFKNYPYPLFLALCKQTLKKDGYLCLYFHPWEFTNIAAYSLPKYVARPDGTVLQQRLVRLIKDISAYGTFTTMYRWVKEAMQ